MKAWISGANGPQLSDIDRPEPGPEDVVVKVKATALNRADLFMAGGGTHGALGGPGAVLGLEWAGEIVAMGPEVKGWAVGDRVMASGGGAFAEYALADAGRIVPIPGSMSDEEAAGLPVALQTMHNALATEGALKAGQSVLIHGASSGVGLMGMKMAKVLGAGFVAGTARNAEKRDRFDAFGADLALDPSDPDWARKLKAATDDGVDLVIDQISGPDFNLTLRATKVHGRIVNVGRLGGQTGEVDFNLHALRRITYVGVTFRTRTKAEVREIVRLMRADLEDALGDGDLKLPVDRIYPFEEAKEALAHMEANKHFGKIVLMGA